MLDPMKLQALTPAEKAEYTALSVLFESDGWRYFEARMWAEYESARLRKEHAPSWEQNRVAHGEVDTYRAILSLPLSIDNEYEVEDMPESGDDE